jgi:hypothetical protein
LLNRRVKFGFLLLEGGNIATTLLQHLVEPFLQELGHLHLVGSYGDFGFDVGVSVVDDGQEHVLRDFLVWRLILGTDGVTSRTKKTKKMYDKK